MLLFKWSVDSYNVWTQAMHLFCETVLLLQVSLAHFCLALCLWIQSILPSGYDYIICNLLPFEAFDGEERFSSVFRVAMGTAEKAEQWLYEFQSSSKTTWRVDKTYPDPQTKVVFKVTQHSTNGFPLALRSLPRVFSQKFLQQLKTTLFRRTGVGSASE